MRFDLISLVLQAAAALSCVYFRETMSAGLVGVVMVQSFSSIRAFRLTLKCYVDVESKMTYAERVFEYTDLPIEPSAQLKDDPSEGMWPRDGQIEFRGVSMRYRDKYATPHFALRSIEPGRLHRLRGRVFAQAACHWRSMVSTCELKRVSAWEYVVAQARCQLSILNIREHTQQLSTPRTVMLEQEAGSRL